MVTLNAPSTGSQFQISLSVPRIYQQIPINVQAGSVVPGTLQVLVDGRSVYRFPGDTGGEWLWVLQEGTHRIQAIARDAQGALIRSGVSIIQVVGPQTPL